MVTERVYREKRIFLGWPGWGSQWSCCTVEHDPRQELSSFELGNKVLTWQQLEKCKTTPEMVCLYQVLFYKTANGAVETEQKRATSMRGGLRCFSREGRLRKQKQHSLQKRSQTKRTVQRVRCWEAAKNWMLRMWEWNKKLEEDKTRFSQCFCTLSPYRG